MTVPSLQAQAQAAATKAESDSKKAEADRKSADKAKTSADALAASLKSSLFTAEKVGRCTDSVHCSTILQCLGF